MSPLQTPLLIPKGAWEIEHAALVGQTGCGKTRLAHLMAETSPREVIVFTLPSMPGGQWPARCKVYTNEEHFLRVYWASKGLDVFIDECSRTIGHYNRAMIDTATIGRNQGHRNFYIIQRLKRVSPDVVENCSWLYMFRAGKRTALELAEEWSCDELERANRLKKLEYWKASRFEENPALEKFTVPID